VGRLWTALQPTFTHYFNNIKSFPRLSSVLSLLQTLSRLVTVTVVCLMFRETEEICDRHCINVAGNSGLCASSVLEGLSRLPYSEKEREIGLALRQAALKGSEFVCQVTATGRPTAAGCCRNGRLSFPYVPQLNTFLLTPFRSHCTKCSQRTTKQVRKSKQRQKFRYSGSITNKLILSHPFVVQSSR
jgi:hypothetical protein